MLGFAEKQEGTRDDADSERTNFFGDRGNNRTAVKDALEELRRANFLGYSEKHGYKLQSSSGEEWERERRDLVTDELGVAAILWA